MSSVTKENYLKALYALSQEGKDVSISELGKRMNVSKPTVNDMIKKFKTKGWVKYVKYKPVQLTKEGNRIAALIVRKHRLTEMFLSKVMGFGWEEVHDIAEEIEHIDSESFFDRMDEILGFPTVDPHGSPIPDKNGEMSFHQYLPLSQCEVGNVVKVRALRESSTDFLIFLNKKNVVLGTQIKILDKEEFDNSIHIKKDGEVELDLSYDVARRLLVE